MRTGGKEGTAGKGGGESSATRMAHPLRHMMDAGMLDSFEDEEEGAMASMASVGEF